MHNKLLQRQIDKYLKPAGDLPEDLAAFLKAVSESYDHYEKDRKMLERSIELSSKEMIELNRQLRNEAEENSRMVYEKLKESLVLLNDENDEVLPADADPYKLFQVAELLKNETARRRQAEREQAQRQHHLQSSQRIAHVGSWELKFTTMGRVPIYVSDETYKIFGVEKGAEMLASDIFYQSIHPDDRELVSNAFSEAVKTKKPYNTRHRIVLPDGTEKTVNEMAEIVYDKETGAPLRAIGTTQDITETVSTNLELQQANNEIRTLFENMQEVFYSVDMQSYQLIQISNSCEEIYGYTREEFFQNPNLWFDVIFEEDKQVIYDNYPTMHAGLPFTHTYRIHHKNGGTRWLESRMRPILNENGELVRLYGVTQDVTRREEYELALKTSNDELKKSNRELDKFVYSVSHDLRAPLSSMLGLLEISEPLIEHPVLQKNMTMVKNSIVKLDGFIHDILDYSRNSRLEVNRQQVNFNEMLEDISNNLRFMSANEKVHIFTEINTDIPFHSDKNRVSIILNNLISNAIRYHNPNIPDPFVKVNINISEQSAQIEVIDNGIGISEENCTKVFEMFYRVSKKSVGSGLGLYIVKESVDKLGGTIDISSEPDKGTQFTISLPNLND